MGTLDFELGPRMDQRLEDYVLDKIRYSSFSNTSLEVILRGVGVDTLVICRVITEICFESTIRDAYFRDFKILGAEGRCSLDGHWKSQRDFGYY
jgi:ureidoacrylate peracid hydrolase